MKQILLGVLLAALLASPTTARFQRFHNFGATTGVVAADPLSLLSVYSGCVQPTRAATSKKWYFAVSPLDGKTPADWQTAGVLQAQWGDVNHPLYPVQNLFNFGAFPFTQSAGWFNQTTPIGNNSPLDGLNIYQGLPNLSVHQSFTTLSSMMALDTNHFHLWPGDEVILRGHTGVNAGTWNIGGIPGTASPIGGSPSEGLDEVDDAGNPIHVYIHGDPNFPRPIFTTINVSSTVGTIIQGVNAYNTFDPSTAKSSRFFNWGTSQPTNGQTLNLNGHVITWKTTPTATDDVLIDPNGYQRTLLRTAENYTDSSDPLASAMTVSSQQSNFTLVQPITVQPTNGQTIAVNGVTWTWVSASPTGNQILIGATLAASLTNAATAFKASALTAMKLFTNYIAAATSLSYVYGPAAQPASGVALTVNGQTWTFVTGAAGANQIQISPTNTAATIWETLGNAILAFDAVTNPWGAGVTYTTNGSGILTIATTTGVPGLYKTQSTFPQADLDAPLNFSTWGLAGIYTFHTSGSVAAPMHDNILDDFFATSWDGLLTATGTNAPRDLYPVTGSLGISPVTGVVVPGNVGGPWNIMDWTIIPNLTGISLNGSSTFPGSPTNSSEGNYCQTVSNTSAWYTGAGMGVGQLHDSLMQNVAVNYTGDDQYDSYSSWNMLWNGFKATNPLNNGLAFHPDFLQVGVVGVNNGVMSNNVFNAGQLYSSTDTTVLNDPGWTDMNGGTKPLGGGPQAVNANGAIHQDITVTNSLFITTACLGISTEVVATGSVDLENNTVIWPGQVFGGVGRCTTTPSITPHPNYTKAVTETIVVRNNVAHSYAIGSVGALGATRCPMPANVLFDNNRIVENNAGGTLQVAVSSYCPDGASAGSLLSIGAPPASIFNGGATFTATPPLPANAFTTFPTSNLLGDGSAYNLVPKPAGPLVGTGTTNTLCCNVLGATRVPPPNIGAY